MNRPQNLPTAYANPIPIMYRAHDPILHNEAYPFCDDPECPCKYDLAYYEEYVSRPFCDGLLSFNEAHRLFDGKQI